MTRIAALTAVDLPLLQSVSLRFQGLRSNIVLHDSEILKLPTLRRVSLNNDSRMFTINWVILTSITLPCNTRRQIWRILQKTPCLEFCDIVVPFSEELYAHEINLPHLKTLIVVEILLIQVHIIVYSQQSLHQFWRHLKLVFHSTISVCQISSKNHHIFGNFISGTSTEIEVYH